jgi:hypothetical protein
MTKIAIDQGPMLWFFLNFWPKNVEKKSAFLTQNKAKFWKKIDHNIGFWEKRQFFAENRQKSLKIVIITSTPGPNVIIF